MVLTSIAGNSDNGMLQNGKTVSLEKMPNPSQPGDDHDGGLVGGSVNLKVGKLDKCEKQHGPTNPHMKNLKEKPAIGASPSVDQPWNGDAADFIDLQNETPQEFSSLTVRDIKAEPETKSSAPKSKQNQKGCSSPPDGEEVGSGGFDRAPSSYVDPERVNKEVALDCAERQDQPKEASRMSVLDGTDSTDGSKGIQAKKVKRDKNSSSPRRSKSGNKVKVAGSVSHGLVATPSTVFSTGAPPGMLQLPISMAGNLTQLMGIKGAGNLRPGAPLSFVQIPGQQPIQLLSTNLPRASLAGQTVQLQTSTPSSGKQSNQGSQSPVSTATKKVQRDKISSSPRRSKSGNKVKIAGSVSHGNGLGKCQIFVLLLIFGIVGTTPLQETAQTNFMGFFNATPIINQLIAKMKHENLTVITTMFKLRRLGGFYNLGQDTMYRENLTENGHYYEHDQLCASLDTGTLMHVEDQTCTDKLKFVCRVNDMAGPSDLVIKGATYRLIKMKMSWPDAKDYCFRHQGILATPDSVNDTDELIRQLIEHFKEHLQERFWFGLRKQDTFYEDRPAFGIPWMEQQPNDEYECVVLIRNQTTEKVQAKTVNCSTLTDDDFTTQAPLPNSTTELTPTGNETSAPDVSPSDSQNAAKTAVLAVVVPLIIIAAIVGAVCLVRKYCPIRPCGMPINQNSAAGEEHELQERDGMLPNSTVIQMGGKEEE